MLFFRKGISFSIEQIFNFKQLSYQNRRLISIITGNNYDMVNAAARIAFRDNNLSTEVSSSDPRLCEHCRANVFGTNRQFGDKFPMLINDALFDNIINETDAFIFDADGVLWLGNIVINGAPQFLDYLKNMGKRIIVLTNNSTKSRVYQVNKMRKLGFSHINEDNIVNPAVVLKLVLMDKAFPSEKRVYLIGSQGLMGELGDAGIQCFGPGPDPIEVTSFQDEDLLNKDCFIYSHNNVNSEENVGAVIVGFEKHFNYIKMMRAANFLQDKKCLFLGTNEDETAPGPLPNTVIPDTGPILAAVKTAAGRVPTVVGKPNKYAFEYIRRKWNIIPERTLMIGDRTNTDVLFGKRNGLKTLLVLSGCHSLEDVKQNQRNGHNDMVPDYYAASLSALMTLFQ